MNVALLNVKFSVVIRKYVYVQVTVYVRVRSNNARYQYADRMRIQ